MPLSISLRSRLWVASGLLVLATFAQAMAQEAPIDPNQTDIALPAREPAAFHPVQQLAPAENDYPACHPPQQSFHPPIYYPEDELYCPTGVVHRDWFRAKTVGFFTGQRQKMLEDDYVFRAQNGHQTPCCPPHSCWGHGKKSWFCFGKRSCGSCESCGACGKAETPCGAGCTTNTGCAPEGCGDHTSALENPAGEVLLTDHEAAGETEINDEPGLVLISDEHLVGSNGTVDPAGFCEVSDGCVTADCPQYVTGGYSRGHFCPLHGRSSSWDECEFDGPHCDCPVCRMKHCFTSPFRNLCYMLHADGVGYHGVRGRDGWHREIPAFGVYSMAYPVNPYHFDQRDGRIYAAQGYGHPVAVPMAPNVEHTYNYSWGLPSSRLTPVSRMPGAPGVANPAVPQLAGPGVLPPGFPMTNPDAVINMPQ